MNEPQRKYQQSEAYRIYQRNYHAEYRKKKEWKQYYKKWLSENKERQNELRLKWYYANREVSLAYAKKYNQEHRDEIRLRNKQRRAAVKQLKKKEQNQ